MHRRKERRPRHRIAKRQPQICQRFEPIIRLKSRTCLIVLIVLLKVAGKSGLTPVVLPYTTEAATSGHPEVKDTSLASVQVPKSGACGGGVNPKKYSTLSSRPLKFPTGEILPEALSLKSPFGIADTPCLIKSWLLG